MDMAFNGRSCLEYYGLMLEDCCLSAAKRKQQLLDIPGADGAFDLLKNWGEPTYETRTLTARFTATQGARQTLRRLVYDLEGKTVPIILPGFPARYMTGTVHISAGSVARSSELLIAAECDPWLYARQERKITVPASETAVNLTLRNSGGRRVVPELTVTGADAVITLAGETLTFAPGTHEDARFAIPGGGTLALTVQGGAVAIQYREAVLL